MTMGYGPSAMAPRTSEIIPAKSQAAADCNLPMGYVSFFFVSVVVVIVGLRFWTKILFRHQRTQLTCLSLPFSSFTPLFFFSINESNEESLRRM